MNIFYVFMYFSPKDLLKLVFLQNVTLCLGGEGNEKGQHTGEKGMKD